MKDILGLHPAWLKRAGLPLQVIGILSSTVFVLNVSTEILLLRGLQRELQMLLFALLIGLSGWAILECLLLQHQQNAPPLRKLLLFLIAQISVECLRLGSIFWGPELGVDRHYGIRVLHYGPLFILLPAYLLVFLAIAKSLIASYVHEIKGVNHLLEQANQELQRMTAIQVEQSRQQEREHLLRDMHDGFGSQLASVRILAEQGRITAEQLPQYLQEITADLHLIADTLSQEDISLPSALSNLRYRLGRRFSAGSPHLYWTVQLDCTPSFEPHVILHILRIMQEAFNNAIRHASPQTVWFRAEYDPVQHRLLVSVRDDGPGLPVPLRPGRGLNNMQQRAREMGAELARIDHHPGTEIRLTKAFNPPGE